MTGDHPERAPLIVLTFDLAELDVFHQWRDMFRGIVEAGGIPLAVDCGTSVPHIGELIARADGVIISGGGDVDPTRYGGDPDDPLLHGVTPIRDANEIAAMEAARAHGKPLLAVCRGAQLLNVACGGTLYADLARDVGTETDHRRTIRDLDNPVHTVDVVPGSRLSAWLGASGTIDVNSQHHQGMRQLAPQLTPSAYSTDGLVEAFEIEGEDVVGVQWHPEVLWRVETHARTLLQQLVAVSAARRQDSVE